MDVTTGIQVAIARADLAIGYIAHYLPYIAISLFVGCLAGRIVYKKLSKKSY